MSTSTSRQAYSKVWVRASVGWLGWAGLGRAGLDPVCVCDSGASVGIGNWVTGGERSIGIGREGRPLRLLSPDTIRLRVVGGGLRGRGTVNQTRWAATKVTGNIVVCKLSTRLVSGNIEFLNTGQPRSCNTSNFQAQVY